MMRNLASKFFMKYEIGYLRNGIVSNLYKNYENIARLIPKQHMLSAIYRVILRYSMLNCLPIAQNYACAACCAKFRADIVGFASTISTDANRIDATSRYRRANAANDWVVTCEH